MLSECSEHSVCQPSPGDHHNEEHANKKLHHGIDHGWHGACVCACVRAHAYMNIARHLATAAMSAVSKKISSESNEALVLEKVRTLMPKTAAFVEDVAREGAKNAVDSWIAANASIVITILVGMLLFMVTLFFLWRKA